MKQSIKELHELPKIFRKQIHSWDLGPITLAHVFHQRPKKFGIFDLSKRGIVWIRFRAKDWIRCEIADPPKEMEWHTRRIYIDTQNTCDGEFALSSKRADYTSLGNEFVEKDKSSCQQNAQIESIRDQSLLLIFKPKGRNSEE